MTYYYKADDGHLAHITTPSPFDTSVVHQTERGAWAAPKGWPPVCEIFGKRFWFTPMPEKEEGFIERVQHSVPIFFGKNKQPVIMGT